MQRDETVVKESSAGILRYGISGSGEENDSLDIFTCYKKTNVVVVLKIFND